MSRRNTVSEGAALSPTKERSRLKIAIPLFSVLTAAVVAIAAAVAAAAQPAAPLPSEAELSSAAKKVPNTNDALRRATERASGARPGVPDVSTVGPALRSPSVPDPAEIARRLDGQGSPNGLPRILIAVSLSMPKETLDRLAQQAAKVGAHLVLRGMVGDSLVKTAKATAPFVERHVGLQFDIDPTIFRRFGIQRVPTFVLTRDDQELRSCTTECDATDYYVSVAGDVTLDYALEHIGQRSRPPFNARAETLLGQLRETR